MSLGSGVGSPTDRHPPRIIRRHQQCRQRRRSPRRRRTRPGSPGHATHANPTLAGPAGGVWPLPGPISCKTWTHRLPLPRTNCCGSANRRRCRSFTSPTQPRRAFALVPLRCSSRIRRAGYNGLRGEFRRRPRHTKFNERSRSTVRDQLQDRACAMATRDGLARPLDASGYRYPKCPRFSGSTAWPC